MAAVVVVRYLLCSEMSIAGLLFPGNLLCHNPPDDDLLAGDARPLGDALLPDGDDPVVSDVPDPHNTVSEASVCTSRAVGAVVLEFL